jgi:hypothetical protein
MRTCKRCSILHDGSYGKGDYCSENCRRRTKKYVQKKCKTCQSEFEAPENGKEYCTIECWKSAPLIEKIRSHKNRWNPTTLWGVSSRTITKILKRLNVGCSRCGWKEATCDLHHIHGKKIDNPNDHSNLTILCPNCHRMFHCGLIGASDVQNLNDHIGDSWKQHYFG